MNGGLSISSFCAPGVLRVHSCPFIRISINKGNLHFLASILHSRLIVQNVTTTREMRTVVMEGCIESNHFNPVTEARKHINHLPTSAFHWRECNVNQVHRVHTADIRPPRFQSIELFRAKFVKWIVKQTNAVSNPCNQHHRLWMIHHGSQSA